MQIKVGISYFAVDYSRKEQMWAPGRFSDKCIFHPHHPLPHMIAIKNFQGCNFEIINDLSIYEEHKFKDVTDDVYKELKEKFPDFDWHEYEKFD